jgi:predicted amidohydrolase YtcJ
MAKRAILNAAIYVGGGEVIPKGFVLWDRGVIEGVGGVSAFPGESDVEVEDLPGKLVLPGLVDSHLHLVGYALSLRRINLAGTRSVDEALGWIAAHVDRLGKGEWLRGRGWDKQHWGLDRFPDRLLLDRVTPDNPAVLSSRDGHLVWVNSAGLACLGLDRGEIQVEGGEVETDTTGRPTGIFKEKAADLVLRQVEEAGEIDAGPAIREACRLLLAMGITGVHTSENPRSMSLLDQAAGAGSVPLKTVRMLEVAELDDIERAARDHAATHIKILADGALGSQTAAMLEPYCGQPDNYGIMAVPKPKLLALAERAVAAGFSLAVHAIGDKANREVLDVFEQVRATEPGRKAVLRVEHVQVLRPEEIPRFGKLGVIASVQPIHLVGDTPVAERYWGARSRYAYAFRSILDTGGRLAFGSDAPIEDPDPLLGLHAAVTRTDPNGRDATPWYPEERITVSEAIDAYTAGAALAAGTSGAGRITAGMPADLTVVDRDITGPDPDAILDTHVVLTIANGDPFHPGPS